MTVCMQRKCAICIEFVARWKSRDLRKRSDHEPSTASEFFVKILPAQKEDHEEIRKTLIIPQSVPRSFPKYSTWIRQQKIKIISTHFKKKRVWATQHTSCFFAVSLSSAILVVLVSREIFRSFRYVFNFLGKEFLKRNHWSASVSVQPSSGKVKIWNCLRVFVKFFFSYSTTGQWAHYN